jgi:hypothetical protein
MAEYIRFRMTAAKAGVTMALAALVAGVTERAQARSQSRGSQAGFFVKLTGLTGEVKTVMAKIEAKVVKLDTAVSQVQKKLRTEYYTRGESNKVYLKIRDAGAEFLKKAETAANSAKLGNLAPSAFVQGNHGSVVSGALSKLSSSSQQLLSLPGGIIVVRIADTPGAGATLTVHNATGGTLAAVSDVGGKTQQITLNAGDNQLPAVQAPADVRIQIFPGGTFTDVVSILIGLTPTPANSQQTEAVAQAFTGGV